MHVLILGFGSVSYFFPVSAIVAHKDSVVSYIAFAGAVQKLAVIYCEIVECVGSLQVNNCVGSCRNIAPAEILVVGLGNTVNQICSLTDYSTTAVCYLSYGSIVNFFVCEIREHIKGYALE